MVAKAVVFVGSSVNGSDLERIRQGPLEVRPPIRRGDLPGVICDGYDFIGIIDGELFQGLTVPPKEILAALFGGREIVGGASVGALRAADLSTFGMRGIGVIYRWYQSRRVTRDDDVALRYTADEGIYRALTVPMVNVTWVVAAARQEQWLDPPDARRVMAAARRTPWSQRTWPGLAAAARLAGGERSKLLAYAADPAHDLTRLDALAVVDYMQRIVSHAAAPNARRPG